MSTFAPSVSIDAEDNGLTIHVNPHYDYEISGDRIKTKEQLDEWVNHLQKKVWFTPEIRFSFLKLFFSLHPEL